MTPGGRSGWTVVLRNPSGTAPVTVQLALSGEVAEWAWPVDDSATVPAGGEASVRVAVRVPPPPVPVAGRYELVVAAGDAVCRAELEVLPVMDVDASLNKSNQLTVRNRGNAPVRVALSAEGAAVEPAMLAIDPGDLEAATVTPRRGSDFTVEVRPEGGETILVTGPSGGSSPGGGRRSRRPLVLALVAAVVVGGVVVAVRGGGSGPDEEALPDEEVITFNEAAPPSGDCPVAGHLAADPAGIPRRDVPIPDRYAFLEVRPGGCNPVRFNPCEPVHYVTNFALAPPGALEDLFAAFRQLSEATGIEFVHDGPTDEPASLTRRPVQPERYGQRWAPLLIAWDRGRPHNLAATNPGGGRPFNAGGVYVSGFLILNVDAVSDERGRTPLPLGFGPGATWGRVFIHELGHLVGLGHVRTSREIMFDDLGLQTGRAEYHDGDLEGLRLLGREQGCLPVPPAPRVVGPPR